ncbi:serine hydrolase domain-containing protein [Salininema proteolyticum]|uniref:Serine hydrolase domain-containing protein n=1 Tax=Salininema proteolyticum TaxID=1607685 RepID=A0ABV8U4C5_9ACTN
MTITNSIMAGGCAALTALALMPGPASAETSDPPEPPSRSELQRQAEAIVDAGAPGVSITVRDENGEWNGAAGVGDIRTGAPPDPNGLVRIGSVTKSFTATMVLQMVEEGSLRLDDPIDRYLPGLLPYEEPISIRDLLQHRSGLPNYADMLWPDARAASEVRFRRFTPTRLVGMATDDPLKFPPGTDFSYSDTGYIVLGMLIEELADDSFAAELRQRILWPAGLRHTYVAGDFPLFPHPALRGYEALGDTSGELTDLTAFNMSGSWSAGAIVSTSGDVNEFYRKLLAGDLLTTPMLEEMQRTIPAFPAFEYGLGLAGGEFCGQEVWGHVGGVPGYMTYSFTRSDGARQITVTANRSLSAPPEVAEAVFAMVKAEFCGTPETTRT